MGPLDDAPRALVRAGKQPPTRLPSRDDLREAALRHLARFAVTETGLVRVLDRLIQRRSRAIGSPTSDVTSAVASIHAVAREVVGALVKAGVIDDAAFARVRADRLTRAGRSSRGVAAHLAARGVASDVVALAMPAAEAELPAALAYSRRRRIGPFRGDAAISPETRLRELGALARAGFPREVAERALATPADEAEVLLATLRRGRHD